MADNININSHWATETETINWKIVGYLLDTLSLFDDLHGNRLLHDCEKKGQALPS
jgi:hypothetical protein